jgi:hypothetical protein
MLSNFTPEDIKTIIVIGSLLVSSFALLLNLYATHRSTRQQRVANYQEIVKSHREIWKLTLDNYARYERVLSLDVDLKKMPVSYEERRFVQLILLHMSSAYAFASSDQMLEIEKLEFDIEELLSMPIPRFVWGQYRVYQNSRFVRFVEKANKPKKFNAFLHRVRSSKPLHNLSYAKKWHVLLIGRYSSAIQNRIESLGDDVILIEEYSTVVTPQFLKENHVDFLVLFGQESQITRDVLDIVPCVNVHCGLLPFNPNLDPNLWSWIDDLQKGVTVHYLEGENHTGDLIACQEVRVNDEVTLVSSQEIIVAAAVELFLETWPAIRSKTEKREKQFHRGTIHSFFERRLLESLIKSHGATLPVKNFCAEARQTLLKSQIQLDDTPPNCVDSTDKPTISIERMSKQDEQTG